MFRPILACDMEWDKVDSISYPILAQPKLNGIRGNFYSNYLYSRRGKLLPNMHLQVAANSVLRDVVNYGLLDMEITAGTYTETQSAVRSYSRETTFTLNIFDYIEDIRRSSAFAVPYAKRLEQADSIVEKVQEKLPPNLEVKCIPRYYIVSIDTLRCYYDDCVNVRKLEGICYRPLSATYKQGRATWAGQELIRAKPEKTSEARVVSVIELLRNENEAKINALGYTERSSEARALVEGATLGALVVVDLKSQQQFAVGTGQGWTTEFRKEVWENQEQYIGMVLKYKYFDHGIKDKPMSASFLAWMEEGEVEL